jgi:demethylmenaquinone methyltransferase/2-methoxy-6-polyprenyl-1,4-benzoquinol methylase
MTPPTKDGDAVVYGTVTAATAAPTPSLVEEPFERSLERRNHFEEAAARGLIADLGLPAGSRGLDVGCGVGLYALWLAEAVGPGGHVTGVEPKRERVEAARVQTAPARLPAARLAFQEGDGTALPFPDRHFDWVFCGDVLHHILDTRRALQEMARVTRPGGRLVVKEFQVLSALYLPGHPDLERRIQQAETERSRAEAGESTFQERRQRTPASLREAGLADPDMRSYLVQRRAPLADADRGFIQHAVFERNWGARLRDLLTAEDWALRSALCDTGSPRHVLASPDYFCLYPITVFTARVP